MKKKLWIVLFVLLVFAFSVSSVCAASPVRLVDEAGILNASEKAELLTLLDEISQRHGMDIVVVTVDSLGGKSARAFADDYYDENGYGKDGILLLIAINSRDYYIATSGYGITALTDWNLSYMENQFIDDLRDGNYADAFRAYAELCDEFVSEAKSGEAFPLVKSLLISAVIGFIVALIATAIMRAKLKSVRSKASAGDYIKQGSFRVTKSGDRYLYRNVTRRLRPKNDSSGGSSTHRSSSGRSHGGGGGKF